MFLPSCMHQVTWNERANMLKDAWSKLGGSEEIGIIKWIIKLHVICYRETKICKKRFKNWLKILKMLKNS